MMTHHSNLFMFNLILSLSAAGPFLQLIGWSQSWGGRICCCKNFKWITGEMYCKVIHAYIVTRHIFACGKHISHFRRAAGPQRAASGCHRSDQSHDTSAIIPRRRAAVAAKCSGGATPPHNAGASSVVFIVIWVGDQKELHSKWDSGGRKDFSAVCFQCRLFSKHR